MEGISVNVYKGLRSYWKQRGYRRLKNGVVSGREDTNPGQESGSGHRGRRTWRVKIGRRIRVLRRVGSPRKWLTRLRDAYVKMMLNFANTGLVGGGYGGPVCVSGSGKGEFKEYDERVIVEIYKSLVMAQGQFMPHEAPKQILSHRRHVVSAG